MNRQVLREDIQKAIERWNQLKQHYGDQAVNVPEYVQLTKVIKAIQAQQQAMLQRQAQQRQQQAQPQQTPQQQQQRPNQQRMMSQQPQGMSNSPEQNFGQQNSNYMNNMGNMNQGNGGNANGVNNSMGNVNNMNVNNVNMNNMNMNNMGMNNMNANNVNPMHNMNTNNVNAMHNVNPMSNMNNLNMNMNVNPMNNLNSNVSNINNLNSVNGSNISGSLMGTPNMPYASNPGMQNQLSSQSLAASNIGTPSSMGSQHQTPHTQNQPQGIPQAQPQLQVQHQAQSQHQIPPQLQQVPQQNSQIYPNNIGGRNAIPPGGALTGSQLQAVKAQYQALRLLLKNPSPYNNVIPQNIAEFATNERLALANGNYLPSNKPSSQVNAQPIPNQTINTVQTPAIPQQHHVAAPLQNHQTTAGISAAGTPLMGHAMSNSRHSSRSNNSPYIQTAPNPAQIDTRAPKVKQSGRSTPLSGTNSQKPTKKESGFIPVDFEPHVPQLFKDFVPDEKENKKTIIPIDQANVQVDCFEFPPLVGDDAEEISFQHIFSTQTRFQYPGLYPEGIDMNEIRKNREAHIALRVEHHLDDLKEQLRNEIDEKRREEILAEIETVRLLPFQKQLKGSILSNLWFGRSLLPNSHPNFLAKLKPMSMANIIESHLLYKRQVHSLLQAQNQKHQHGVTEVLRVNTKSREKQQSKKEKVARIVTKVNSLHGQVAREEQKKLERMAKQRLQALKSNDEEAYLKLLDHTKDTRITQLLKQTNTFLDSLAQAVQSQQKESGADIEEDGLSTDERREKLDYYHVAHRIKEEVTKQPSILVGGSLKEYQLKGLQWMVSLYNNHLNGILADEMGLGKTIQTISLLTYLVEVKKVNGPFLVIVPLSTLTNWNIEFDKWAPTVKKITYKGTPAQRKSLQVDVRSGNFQILLTTFEYIIKDRNLLARTKWVHMIIDEGHRMKNANSKLSETLTHHYHSDNRLILTGTPLQNNLPELWALLNFVLPKIFNSVKSFDEWFNTPFANTGGLDKIALSEEETLLIIRRLHKVLRPFLLRRLKKDVEKDLPNKVEKVVKCKMSSLQAKLYQQMLKYNVLYTSVENGNPVTIKNANNQIMQLRKICNHPFVYEEVENLINPRVETNDDIWRVAGKFELLDRILPKFKATGHRVLIFFQMTQIMDIMEDFLRLRNLKYMRLDGGTKADDRTGLLKLFNAPNSEYFCFLLSTRAGGLGLNLQTADTVIIFDTDWNPHQDLQAQDRAHRIGQKNEVRILRLITDNSIEEMILERAHAKLEIDGKVIQAGKFDNKSTAEEQEALLRALIEKEEERKVHSSGDEDDDNLDDDELNQVIARNDNELEVFQALDDARVTETRDALYPSRLYSEGELPEIYKIDPETLFKKEELKADEYGRGNRERKIASYDDHLTEEQWLKQIDGVLSDDDGADSRPKRGRGRPTKAKQKTPNFDDFIVDDDDEDAGSSRKRSDSNDSGIASDNKRAKSSTPSSRGKPKAKGGRIRGRGRFKPSALNRTTPSIDPLTPKEREVLHGWINPIYDAITSYTNEKERNLSELFLVKPSKRIYPDYYVLIKHPLALDTIKKRITSNTYVNVREFMEDIHLMFSNARKYNEEGSVVYEDANILEQTAIDKLKEVSTWSDEEIDRTTDFEEFDQIHGLKTSPLAKGRVESKNSESAFTSHEATKQPISSNRIETEFPEPSEATDMDAILQAADDGLGVLNQFDNGNDGHLSPNLLTEFEIPDIGFD